MRPPRIVFAALLFLIIQTGTLYSQEAYRELTVGGEYLVTAYSFSSPDNTAGIGVEATQWYCMNDSVLWMRMRQYPSMGVRATLGLTPDGICGHRLGMAAVLRSPLEPWVDWETGFGFSTFARSRYMVNDADNVYISTLFTFLITTGFSVHMPSGKRLGLQLIHSSNGYLWRPNRGLNYLQLGLTVPLGSSPREMPWEHVSVADNHHEVGFAMMIGATQSYHLMQYGLYPCYDLSFSYGIYKTPLLAYGATIDLWYNGSHTWQLPRYHDNYPVPVYVGAQGYVENFWGPLSIRLGIGYTLVASSRVLVPMYERLAVYYNFSDSYVGLGINAHGGQAEFIELTYGHRFRVVN